MEFGIFLPAGNHRWVMSVNAPPFEPTFQANREIVAAAERNGFSFGLTNVKLRGFGGPSRYWDDSLESITLMSALAAHSESLQLFGSVAVLTIHPAIAARMAVTIADVSGGRFGLNIVSGWDRNEYYQMGLWPGDEYLSYRYKYSTEYVTIMKELWEKGVSDFKGEYFELHECVLGPRPGEPIKLVCAGQSPTGMAFTSRFGNYSFIMGGGGVEGLTESNQRLLAAAAEAGRDVRSLCYYYCLIEDTDEAAQAKLDHYIAGPDVEAMASWSGQTELDPNGVTAAQVRQSIFSGAELLTGSPETVARLIDERAAVEGVAGMLLAFDDSLEGVERFGQQVLPLLDPALVS